MNLAEHDGPGWRLVAAAAGGLVQAEGLERSGKGEEDQRGGDKDAQIEVDQAGVSQKNVRRRHNSFLHKKIKYDKFGPIFRKVMPRSSCLAADVPFSRV